MNDERSDQMTLPLSRGTRPMRAAQAGDLNEMPAQPADDVDLQSIERHDDAEAPMGPRLRAARVAHGFSVADVSSRLKLPVKLIERLEGDDYEGMTEGVFLRGYLRSYARLVGLPVEQVASVAAARTRTIPLVATGTISRSRYLFDRYSVSATYLVLTAIIVVPAVWLATHGGLEQNLARTTPLDPPAVTSAVAEQPASADAMASSGGVADDARRATDVDGPSGAAIHADAADPAPVIASMAPFVVTQQPAQPLMSTALAPAAGTTHTLSVALSQQSWVEVTTADGRKLEYGMLAAGSEHTYRSEGQLSVRLGNVQGAQVRTDGKSIDLTPFQRGNVAHIRVFDQSGAPVSRIDQ
ncbi:MAG: RodZ domain-containing protein [Dokdonella sp.]|uniref:RodZ domain-containing protein n=1 Tax=Dokdonella sp. TaxID=2291710 RepID=UPI003266597E